MSPVRPTLERNSLAAFLCRWARHPYLHDYHKREGNMPAIYIAPPEEEVDGSYFGWAMLEWVFTSYGLDKIRYRVYFAYAHPHEDCTSFDDVKVPRAAVKMMSVKLLSQKVSSHFEDLTQKGGVLNSRQPRMRSRQDIPIELKNYSSLSYAIHPHHYKVTNEVYKSLSRLAQGAFDTFVHVSAGELPDLVKDLDVILAPCYMPIGTNLVAKIIPGNFKP